MSLTCMLHVNKNEYLAGIFTCAYRHVPLATQQISTFYSNKNHRSLNITDACHDKPPPPPPPGIYLDLSRTPCSKGYLFSMRLASRTLRIVALPRPESPPKR